MFIDTANQSTAVDAMVLPLFSRTVQIAWASGSVAAYNVRRRDQLRLLRERYLLNPDLSYGAFANWAKTRHEFGLV